MDYQGQLVVENQDLKDNNKYSFNNNNIKCLWDNSKILLLKVGYLLSILLSNQI
jgi:hypothetical protein